jgi:outer membrane protein assembly factor BamB
MKKIYSILIATVVLFSSCSKHNDDISNPDDGNGDNNNNEETSSYKWSYSLDDSPMIGSYTPLSMVVDNDDNVYVLEVPDNSSSNLDILSINKNGELNWRSTVTNNFNLADLLAANGIVFVASNSYTITAFDMNDGTKLWERELLLGYSTMAYYNGVLFVTESSMFEEEVRLTAFEAQSGTPITDYSHSQAYYPRMSVNGNLICLTMENTETYPHSYGLIMLKYENSAFTELWNKFYQADESSNIKAHKAIFDGQGNVYYEDNASDSTIVRSYNANTGNENWNTEIKDIPLADISSMLYTQNRLIAAYRSDDSWGIENSFAIINTQDGSIIAKVDEGIQNETLFILSGDDKIVTFKQNNSEGHLITYSLDGNVSSNDILGNTEYIYSFIDVKINSDGDIYILKNNSINCADQSLVKPSSGTWSSYSGTNGNTNALNQ